MTIHIFSNPDRVIKNKTFFILLLCFTLGTISIWRLTIRWLVGLRMLNSWFYSWYLRSLKKKQVVDVSRLGGLKMLNLCWNGPLPKVVRCNPQFCFSWSICHTTNLEIVVCRPLTYPSWLTEFIYVGKSFFFDFNSLHLKNLLKNDEKTFWEFEHFLKSADKSLLYVEFHCRSKSSVSFFWNALYAESQYINYCWQI